MWFGLATAPKIILAATFVFFVVFMNMVAGVYAVNPHQANALRVMGADRRALLMKLVLPGTVPYLMTGLRLAVPEALIGAVVGEFIAANRGLGYLVTSAAAQFNTTGTMAAILALLLIVAVMDLALTLAERRLLRWRPRPAASVVRG
jgi:NitT/TauT family transport system permease protein